MIAFLLIAFILLTQPAHAAIRYLDSSVGSSGNGQSWATAWKNLSNITGLNPGDTVWISGGATTQTYTWGGSVSFLSASGTSGNPITYRVSSEAGKNGTVIIDYSGCSDNQFIWAHPSQGYHQWVTWSGDVGDGTNHLQFVGNIMFAQLNNSVGVTFKYFDITSRIQAYDSTQIEIDHLTFNLVNGIDSYLDGIGRSDGGTSYTTNTIHDNTVYIARDTTLNGLGDDGFKNIHHATVYNNRFIGQVVTYTAGQHGDAIQSLEGTYLRIYNNYFENVAQYGVYLEYFNSGGHAQIFNNIFYNMHSQDISIGSSNSGLTLTDFTVFNNTHRFVSGDAGAQCVAIGGGFSNTTTTSSYVVNELCYNLPTGIVTYNCTGCTGSGNTISNNYVGTTSVTFVDSSNDFHLVAGSTNAIDQGTSPAAITGVTTVDRAGVTRGATWDLGAYEYVAGGGGSSHAISGAIAISGGVVMQ